MSETLKPCPFSHEHVPPDTLDAVGDDPLIVLDNEESGGWSVFCILCGMRGPQMSSRDKAIAAWNRRTPVESPTDGETLEVTMGDLQAGYDAVKHHRIRPDEPELWWAVMLGEVNGARRARLRSLSQGGTP